MWYYKDSTGVQGPYRTEDICSLLSRGILSRGTLLAREGEGSWNSLSMIPEFAALRAGSFRGVNPQVVATLGSSHVQNQYREHLNAIINAQRQLILTYLTLVAFGTAAALLLLLLEDPARTAVGVIFNVLSCATLATFMARLAGAMQIPQWPWVLAACLPCWSLIALLLLMTRANRTLQQAGIPVGLLGGQISQEPSAG